jgi:8-oxo-dGTP pyrophosphatase MutT (NUDIX family)
MTRDCGHIAGMNDLMRHIAACRNAVLPGRRMPLRLGAAQVGWVLPEIAAALAGLGAALDPDGISVPADRLYVMARQLADHGMFRFRDEAFDVRAAPDGPVLAQVDRGAVPALGVLAEGVHLNGLVQRSDGLWVWIARRAAHKLLDPGKLDHLVGGGVPAGLTPWETLAKEADEEAAIPQALIAQALPVARLDYAMDYPGGLRRDRLHCYDLLLPEDFMPSPRDGEVESFELRPLRTVLEEVRQSDAFKFNVSLVLIDLFLRAGLLDKAEGQRLRAALDAPSE